MTTVPLDQLGPSAKRQVDAFLTAEKMQAKMKAPKKPSKYKNKRIEVDGVMFDSMAEARRWKQLLLLERAGKITRLERQVKFPIVLNDQHMFTWIADFVYYEGLVKVTEDVKGYKTPVYKMKKKLVECLYGFKILETK